MATAANDSQHWRAALAEDKQGRVLLRVHVSPGAKATALKGYDPWRKALKISVAAPAVEGKANSELRRYLAELLGVPVRAVMVEEGQKARLKRVSLAGIDRRRLEARLAAELEGETHNG